MKVNTLVRSLAGVLLFGVGVVTGLVAQTSSGMEVIASVAEYKPGDSIGLHTHHGVEAAYVLQGASVQLPGKDPMALATGATVLNLRDVKHGGYKIVGDTSLKLFTVHIVDKGKPLYDYAQ
jgi:quercetin dioxygenase-like cupin family protein